MVSSLMQLEYVCVCIHMANKKKNRTQKKTFHVLAYSYWNMYIQLYVCICIFICICARVPLYVCVFVGGLKLLLLRSSFLTAAPQASHLRLYACVRIAQFAVGKRGSGAGWKVVQNGTKKKTTNLLAIYLSFACSIFYRRFFRYSFFFLFFGFSVFCYFIFSDTVRDLFSIFALWPDMPDIISDTSKQRAAGKSLDPGKNTRKHRTKTARSSVANFGRKLLKIAETS